ncbi:MAG TPA: DUF3795 domain-containing protein [Bacteroidales bacterium]|nr:DUF3795 domain-containing protein [Bacteroidales bacterium]
MKGLISCCGLNCLTCEARIATMKDDDQLRKITAEKWKLMYNATNLDASSINCTGCREEGVKLGHCYECVIRNCVKVKGFETCADCNEVDSCAYVMAIHKSVPEARANLENLKN